MSDAGQNHPEEHLVIPEPLKRTYEDIDASLPRKRTRLGVKPKPRFKRYRKSEIPDNHSSRLSTLPDDVYRKVLSYGPQGHNLKSIESLITSVDTSPHYVKGFQNDLRNGPNATFHFEDNGKKIYEHDLYGKNKKLKPISQRKNINSGEFSREKTNPGLNQRLLDGDPTIPQWYIDYVNPSKQYLHSNHKKTVYPPQSKKSAQRQNSLRISTI